MAKARWIIALACIAAAVFAGAYLSLGAQGSEWRCEELRGWREMPSGGLIIDCSNNIDWERGADPWFGTKNPGRQDPLTTGNLAALEKTLSVGDVGVDFGTGTGFFAFRMLDLVGPSGKVYAIDIDHDMVVLVKETARVTKRSNLVVLDSDESFGAAIAPHSVDVINANGLGLSCDDMERFLDSCTRTLEPDGIVLYEFSPGDANTDGNEPCGPRETSKIAGSRAMAMEKVPSVPWLYELRARAGGGEPPR